MTHQRLGRWLGFLLAAIAAGTLFSVYQLLYQRFEAGDVYPPYSSLRADPLGTMAFHDGLSFQKGISVERNYGPLEKIEPASKAALMVLGEDAGEFFEAAAFHCQDLEEFASRGGRIVLSFLDESGSPVDKKKSIFLAEDTETPIPTAGATPKPTRTPVPVLTLEKKWGVTISREPLPKDTEKKLGREISITLPVTVTRGDAPGAPRSLLWHSGLVFTPLDDAWKGLYYRGPNPVALRRGWGKGEIILFLDSYPLSNEAMRNERHPDLLAYLVGNKTRILFDETHLGVEERPNTATLARQYGLMGFVIGLLVLALLFVWRNSLSLVPPPVESDVESSGHSGKDFSAGLINLLRRNIPAEGLLKVCLEKWEKTVGEKRPWLKPRAGQMRKKLGEMESAGRKKPHPVEGYLLLSRILKKGK